MIIRDQQGKFMSDNMIFHGPLSASKMKHWELKKLSWIVGCVHQHVVVYMLNGRSDIFFEFIDRNAIMAGQTSSSSSLAEMQLNLQPWC